jgi:hypothetical protein
VLSEFCFVANFHHFVKNILRKKKIYLKFPAFWREKNQKNKKKDKLPKSSKI